MFRTGSPYSPFFTSGLLVHDYQPRRASLPPDNSSPALSLPPKVPSLRLRRSRDSMRSIPSAKPAPSTTLPDVPRQSTPSSARQPTPPPRLPSITINTSLSLSLDRPSPSAPKRDSSVVSPTVRKFNRSHALARLEGRTNSTRRRSKPVKRNFMSMSDEESDADDDVPPTVTDQPQDLVLPLSLSEPRTVPLRGRSVRTKSTSSRKHHSTSKDWFSLKSFIDLQAAEDDTAKFSWRSFIEVARVS